MAGIINNTLKIQEDDQIEKTVFVLKAENIFFCTIHLGILRNFDKYSEYIEFKNAGFETYFFLWKKKQFQIPIYE